MFFYEVTSEYIYTYISNYHFKRFIFLSIIHVRDNLIDKPWKNSIIQWLNIKIITFIIYDTCHMYIFRDINEKTICAILLP